MTTKAEWIRRHAVPPILDVACGHSSYFWLEGENGKYHIEDRVEYLACDLNVEPIDVGNQRPKNFIQADAHKIPIEDDSFYTVIIASILPVAEFPVDVIREAKRIATDKILLAANDYKNWKKGVSYDDFDYLKHKYTDEKLLDDCGEAGLDPRDISLGYTIDPPITYWVAEARL